MDFSQPTVAIMAGLVVAIVSMYWLWRTLAHPSIIGKQEATLDKQYRRMDAMQQEMDELRAMMIAKDEEYEARIEEVYALLDEWWHGMQRVFEQMGSLREAVLRGTTLQESDLKPVWTPKPISRPRKQPVTRSALAQRIAAAFDNEEIDSLAFEIGVHKDEFAGSTKEARARELVELAFRRGITSALAARVNELRGEK